MRLKIGSAAVAVGVIVVFLLPWASRLLLDLDVYRLGGEALLHGGDLYEFREPTNNLPFTYPVFAALLFVPYAVMPLWLAKVVTLTVSLGALWVIVHLSLRHIWGPEFAARWSAPVAVLGITTHPVLDTLSFGQVNTAIAALVLLDVLVLRGRWRGGLIGLATGIKLVSGLFIAYYLVTRQFRAAATAAGTFAATVAIGFAVRPRDSWDYWTVHMLDPARVGDVEYVANQSLLGTTARLLRDVHPPSALTLTLSAVAALAALWLATRATSQLMAVCLVAAGSLLASPISWSHHFVWLLPAFLLLISWARERRGRWHWPWWVVGFVGVLLWSGPMRFTPKRDQLELEHNLAQQLVANCYTALAVAFLVWAALRPVIPTAQGPAFAPRSKPVRSPTPE